MSTIAGARCGAAPLGARSAGHSQLPAKLVGQLWGTGLQSLVSDCAWRSGPRASLPPKKRGGEQQHPCDHACEHELARDLGFAGLAPHLERGGVAAGTALEG